MFSGVIKSLKLENYKKDKLLYVMYVWGVLNVLMLLILIAEAIFALSGLESSIIKNEAEVNNYDFGDY